MSAGKQTRLDFAAAAASGTKQSKTDPLSPQKMAAPPEAPEGLKEVLKEVRAVRCRVDANGESLDKVQTCLKELSGQMQQLTLRVEKVERAAAEHEERLALIPRMSRKLEGLEKSVEDMSNRARRNNVRVLGIPEGAEGSDSIRYLESLIPQLLKLDFSRPFEIERAHRLPSSVNQRSKFPRPMIFCALRHLHAIQILMAAKTIQPLLPGGQKVAFYPDFSKPTVERRKRFLAFRPRLQRLQAKYGLFSPARFKVTLNNETKTFDDPAELAVYIEDQEALQMQSS